MQTDGWAKGDTMRRFFIKTASVVIIALITASALCVLGIWVTRVHDRLWGGNDVSVAAAALSLLLSVWVSTMFAWIVGSALRLPWTNRLVGVVLGVSLVCMPVLLNDYSASIYLPIDLGRCGLLVSAAIGECVGGVGENHGLLDFAASMVIWTAAGGVTANGLLAMAQGRKVRVMALLLAVPVAGLGILYLTWYPIDRAFKRSSDFTVQSITDLTKQLERAKHDGKALGKGTRHERSEEPRKHNW